MKYNILFQSSLGGGYNLLELEESKLPIIIDAYEYSKPSYTLAGKSYTLTKVNNFKIFTYEKEIDFDNFKKYCIEKKIIRESMYHFWYDEVCLELLGKDVTEKYVGDNPFGYKSNLENKTLINEDFIHISRLEELKAIQSAEFDLSRLIKLCEEINFNYRNRNFLSAGMIGRTILNHIPPIFKFRNFDEVANNYGGSSFKKNMQLLNGYFKNAVDVYLHQQIRKKETVPNETQVEFRQPLDVLLAEIISILN